MSLNLVFNTVIRLIVELVIPIVKDKGRSIIMEHGVPLAKKLVEEFKDKNLTSAQKRQAVCKALKAELKKILSPEDQSSLTTSILNLLIELAVNNMKSSDVKK